MVDSLFDFLDILRRFTAHKFVRELLIMLPGDLSLGIFVQIRRERNVSGEMSESIPGNIAKGIFYIGCIIAVVEVLIF